jgi:site-specific DNA-methyltransferase (adenine-specific)
MELILQNSTIKESIEDEFQVHNQKVFFSSSEKMEEIEDESIDIIITSPPYNRGKKYSSDTESMYNDKLPENQYLEFLTRIWRECYKKGSNKSIFFLNIGDSAMDQGISEKVAQTAEKVGWIRIQDIIWVKSIHGRGHYTPSGGNKRFNNVWEHIYLFVKKRKDYTLNPKSIGIPYADKSNIGRYGDSDLRDPGNVWHIRYEKTTGKTIKKGHEAPFPIGLPYKCLKCVPNAKSVLDPFLGTGTTLAAALSLGISGYGYELFPRKELIEKTIRSGLDYKPKLDVLIPHYETTIVELLKVIKILGIHQLMPRSKIEVVRRKILIDTIEKMNIKPNLFSEVQSCLSNPSFFK